MANTPTYLDCPYCDFRYKDSEDPKEHKRFTDAIAGHINLKHPNKPKVKVAQDFKVEIPAKDPEEAKKAIAKRKAELMAQLKALESDK